MGCRPCLRAAMITARRARVVADCWWMRLAAGQGPAGSARMRLSGVQVVVVPGQRAGKVVSSRGRGG